MARTSASSKVLTDHDEIRRWAEERGARPARVNGTGNGDDVGIIRLDFPGYTGEDSLEEISWDDWFRKFDESNLALIVQDRTARGQKSNFNKLVSRETLEELSESRGSARRQSSTGSNGRGSRSQSRGSRSASSRSRSSQSSGASRSSRSSRSKTSSRSSGSSRSGGAKKSSRTTARSRSGKKSSSRASSGRGNRRRAA